MGLLTFSARHFSDYLHPFFLNFFFVQRAKFFHYYYYYIIFIYCWTTVDVSYFCRSCCCTRSPVPLPKIWEIFCLPRASSYCTPLSSLTKCRLYQIKKICPTRSQLLRLTSESMLSVAICERTINNSPIYVLKWLCDEFSV